MRQPSTEDAAEEPEEDAADEANDVEISSIDPDEDEDETVEDVLDSSPPPAPVPERRRKRKHDTEEVEDVYMRRLAREEAKEAETAAAERAKKRQKINGETRESETRRPVDKDATFAEEDGSDVEADKADVTVEDEMASPPPKHETEIAADVELSKANRTVFLGNVSTAAISSKSSQKQLLDHLKSFFESVAKPKDDKKKYALESIRFRSTPFASAIPKKAAFATKQLMDATAKCTNAYVVYSHSQLAREAAKQLNGTEILGRHLRVDEIAHPSKVDHRRCVFVGNLGFVDDESNINQANEEDGREKRKPGKEPADIDEGLWRTFGKCGKVESVRVIRDSTTRVGKGIAYVQFEDANAVEAALLYDGKKFPPMLPRKLRVSRSKAQKRNAKPGSGRPTSKPRTNGYQRKVTGEEASQMGRAKKLYGRAAAAQVKRQGGEGAKVPDGMRKPEDIVFEGHRASSKGGKAGLKLGGKGKGKKKGVKPTNRSAKRGAAFKAAKKGK